METLYSIYIMVPIPPRALSGTQRERYETATSLEYKTRSVRNRDICSDIVVTLCPYVNPPSVVLQYPNRTMWKEMSAFQKGLWIIDETQARWTAFKAELPHLQYVELPTWSAADGTSMPRVHATMSTLLGTTDSHQVYPKVKVHAGLMTTPAQQKVTRKTHERLDVEYKTRMGYNCSRPGPQLQC
jgi:hypothetical protein